MMTMTFPGGVFEGDVVSTVKGYVKVVSMGDRREGDYGFEYEAIVREATEQEVFEHEAHLDRMRVSAHEPRNSKITL
jgi:hypothetical protein